MQPEALADTLHCHGLTQMLKLKIAGAVHAATIALYSATLLMIIKISLAVAVISIAAMAALIANITSTFVNHR